jgi:hypothetical protein
MSKTRACFLHVPKSGGSSVISSLRSTLGESGLFHANESRYQQGPLAVLLNRYPVVAGHFSFAQISDGLLADTFFFTFLREPVDRVLSLYYYYRRQDPARRRDERVAQAQDVDLEPFIESVSERPSPWSNWQTFLFSGATDSEQPAEALLPAALSNLERMDFVGVHDDVDRGFARLCELRGWPAESTLPHENATGDRLRPQELPRDLLARLAALNDCDSVLFGRAREIWDANKDIRRPAKRRGLTLAPPPAAPPRGSGTRDIVFTSISARTQAARRDGTIRENDRVFIDLRAHSLIAVDDLTVGIRISDELGVEVYGTNTRLLGARIPVREDDTFELTFDFEMRLAPGVYRVTAAIHAGQDHLEKCYHWIDDALTLRCEPGDAPKYSGVVNLNAQATIHTVPVLELGNAFRI